MDRRTAIKYTTLLTGATLSTTFMSGFLSGCKPDNPGNHYQPLHLSKEEYDFLSSLTDTLLPATNTPGAVELGVPETLESIVAKCYDDKEQEVFSQRLQLINTRLTSTISGDFAALSGKERLQRVHTLETSLEDDSDIEKAYHEIKANVVSCYLSTEYVGTNLLEYLPVPGEYQPCIPTSELNGKAWTYG